jgi:hypothetical protein
MDYNSYLSIVTSRLNTHYDLSEGFAAGRLTFDLAARFILKNERYIFNKQVATLDSCHNITLCLIKKQEGRMTPAFLNDMLSTVTQDLAEIVKPHGEHMSTTLNLVLVTEGLVEPEVVRTVQNYRFYRSFSLGFCGWCHVGVVLVSLADNTIYTNKVGKGVCAAFNPCETQLNVK